MLARNSSVIQRRLTGSVGSASAAGRDVCWPAATASSKALSFPAVGRHASRAGRTGLDHVVLGEALGELAALGVPQPDPVADPERVRRDAYHRRLDLARALDAG